MSKIPIRKLSLLVMPVVRNASMTNNKMMNKPYLEKFAQNLKKIRTKKGLTQDDLGVNGISRQMISHIELAITDTTVTKLKIIADNLGVTVKDLFDFE